MSLPPEEALDAVISETQPAPLVHAFPEEDLHLLIHEVGREDSTELVALASNPQWEYFLDSDIWDRDRMDLAETTRWLHFLIKADPVRLVRWAAEEKSDLFAFFLSRNLDVFIREHDQDPADFGKDVFTEDDVYYYRFRKDALGPASSAVLLEERDVFLTDFLRRLSEHDHVYYQAMLLESCSLIPSEAEEEMYRLRNVRLAEKGFLPFEEAVSIYQPRASAPPAARPRKRPDTPPESGVGPVFPYYPAIREGKGTLFARALETIGTGPETDGFQSAFAALCNRIIAADRKKIKSREELSDVVSKVSGYLRIGLELRLGSPTPESAAGIIRKTPIPEIFRDGYGRVLSLKRDADEWRRKSWFQRNGLAYGFWDEKWLGVLGGMMLKRPLFFDDYETGVLYREFACMEDVRRTEAVIRSVIAMDGLLARMNPETVRQEGDHFITWKRLLLTLWARHRLDLPPISGGVPLPLFRSFFENIWSMENEIRFLGDAVKADFAAWASGASGLSSEAVSGRYAEIFEALFQEVEEEYAAVDIQELDPRYIALFMVS